MSTIAAPAFRPVFGGSAASSVVDLPFNVDSAQRRKIHRSVINRYTAGVPQSQRVQGEAAMIMMTTAGDKP
jgi:hypothetical protein